MNVNDPAAQAAIGAATDVLDAYEASKAANPRQAIYHQGVNREPGCQVGSTGCNWLVTNDGGYHYSLFAVSKGMGSYIVPNVTDPTNFYAKVADLLLGQQAPDGSWPADLRDDGSPVGATAFSVLALTKAGQLLAVTPPPGETPAPPAGTPPATPAATPTTPPAATAADHHDGHAYPAAPGDGPWGAECRLHLVALRRAAVHRRIVGRSSREGPA